MTQQGLDVTSLSNLNPLSTRLKLWKQNETSLNFVAPVVSFSKQKRFKLHSIYWPQISSLNSTIKNKRKSQNNEIAIKISKMIDEEEKNQIRMKKGNRNLSHHKNHFQKMKRQMSSTNQTTKFFKLSQENQQILNRMTKQVLKKQSKLRDRHGYRSNLYEDPQAESPFISEGLSPNMFKTTGFKTSKRIKLDLPHNYYPGPGTYSIKRYLQSQERQRPQTNRK